MLFGEGEEIGEDIDDGNGLGDELEFQVTTTALTCNIHKKADGIEAKEVFTGVFKEKDRDGL